MATKEVSLELKANSRQIKTELKKLDNIIEKFSGGTTSNSKKKSPVNIDSKAAKIELDKIKNQIKSFDKQSIEINIDDQKVNDELKNVRQNLSEFYERIDSDESQNLAQRVTDVKAIQKELKRLQKIAEDTGDADLANELSNQLEVFGLKVTQAKAELRNFAKTGEKDVSVLGKLFNNVTDEIEKSREELVKLGKNTKGLDKLEKELNEVEREFKQGNISAQKYAKSLQRIEKRSQSATRSSTILSTSLKKLVGVAAGFVAFDKAKDFVVSMDIAVTKLRLSTGATTEEVEKFKNSARNLQAQGFGDFDKNIDTLSQVKRQLELTGEEAEQAAASALIFEQAFGTGPKESIDAIDKAMKAFNISQQEASDILLQGQQQSGDASGDFIDTVREYSSQIGEAGGELDEFINKLLAAEELGIRNTDQFADLYRESIIRIQDASDKTREGFETLGLSYDDFQKGFADGSIQIDDQINIIASKILEIEDPILRNQVAVDLLGTKYEDNGIVIVQALASVEDRLGQFQGATETAAAVVDESLGGQFAKLKAEVGPIFDFLGTAAVNFLLVTVTNVKGAVSTIFSGIRSIPDAFNFVKQRIAGIIPGIISSISNPFESLSGQSGTWGLNIAKSFAKGLLSGLPSVSGAIGAIARKVFANIGARSPTEEGPLSVDQSIWGANIIKAFNEGILSERRNTEKAMQEIADVIGKAVDSAEVREVYNALIKQEQEFTKAKLDEEKKRAKALADSIKDQAETVESLNDKVAKSIEENKQNVKDYVSEIQKIGEAFKEQETDIESDRASSLSERVLEIERDRQKILNTIRNRGIDTDDFTDTGRTVEELRNNFTSGDTIRGKEVDDLIKIGELVEEQIALEEELKLARSQVSEEDIQNAERLENESETERIIRESDEKIAKLKEESLQRISILEEQVQVEIKLAEDSAAVQKRINEKITTDYILELEKRNIARRDFISDFGARFDGITDAARNVNNNNSREINVSIGEIKTEGEYQEFLERLKSDLQ